jgi:uncharacterized SAM-binding protein YcdF (DUF218 family)
MRNMLAALVLPPTGLVVLMVVGLAMRWRWPRFGMTVNVVALVALIVTGMPVVSYNLMIALEQGLPMTPPADHPPQAIVVLSAEMVRSPKDKLGVRPGLLTLDRLRTAAALHRSSGLPILVSGGDGQADLPPLAVMMRQSLEDDFRVPVKWTEDRSTDTWENARFSADILKKDGITSIYLVTHAWHMKRALLAFRGTGLVVTAAPTAIDPPLQYDLGDFLPRAGGWQTGYYAAHEWIGYLWYETR